MTVIRVSILRSSKIDRAGILLQSTRYSVELSVGIIIIEESGDDCFQTVFFLGTKWGRGRAESVLPITAQGGIMQWVGLV